MTAATAADRWTLRLPFEPAAATAARHELAGLLSTRSVPRHVVDDALLVFYELVMNGIDHGRPDAENRLLVFCAFEGDLLQVGVRDWGTEGTVAAQALTSEGLRGRGLAMVEALSERWSVTRVDGTQVSAWVRMIG